MVKQTKFHLRFFNIVLFIIFFILAIGSGLIIYDMSQRAVINVQPSIIPMTESPQKVPQPPVLKKSSYVVAIYGDSMVDTMGEHLEHLQAIFKQVYPNTIIKYYNYGVGSENVSMGLLRFDKPLLYKERNYPPIQEINADILILGSFSYNPYFPHDSEKHKNELTKLINEAKKVAKRVYLLAEIAPLGDGFGKGERGINLEDVKAKKHAEYIIDQLDNTVSLAKSLNIPLINTYYPSQTEGKFTSSIYVSIDDGIHPSDYGHKFIADLIAKTMKFD